MSTTSQKVALRGTEAAADSHLPEGWTVAKIAEICEPPQYGWTTSANKNGQGLKLLRTTDISSGTVEWSSVPACSDEPDEPKKYLLKSGDIVVSRAGSVGLSFLVKNPPRAVFASYLIRFRPLSPVESEFVALFLKSPQYWSAIAEESAGIAIPNVNASKLKRIELPLPPLHEQKRIVAKIEELLAQVNASRARLAKVTQILKRFRQSVLAAACSGRLTEDWRHKNPTARISTKIGEGNPPDEIEIPESWNWFLSAQEFSVVTSGSRGWAKYYADDGPIFIRIGNLNHDSIEIDLKSVQHVRPPSNAEGLRTRVRVGDILISITADVGMIALIDADIGEAYINQHVALARPIGEFDRRYLAYFLAAMNGGQRQFQNLQRGATKVGLGLDDIRSVWIARPPIEEQREIVRRVEALFTLADTIEKRVGAATKRAEKLTQAILAKAFRGELVPTEAELARAEGRDYEPAEKLLARILKERRARWEADQLAKMHAAGKPPKDDRWRAKYKEPAAPDTVNPPQLPEGWVWASGEQLFVWSSGEFLPQRSQRPGPYPVFGGNGLIGWHDQSLAVEPALVIGRVGALCGNVYITPGPAWITDNAIYAIGEPQACCLSYLRHALVGADLNARAAGVGQPFVSQRILNNVPIPLSPAAEQLRIVAEVERRLSVIDELEAAVEANLKRAERLRHSILKRAFEGNLVPQEPNDEPATVLLERIRAERRGGSQTRPGST